MLSAHEEKRLAEIIAGYRFDFYGLVMFLFPWGKPGTILEKRRPEPWQKKYLDDLSAFMYENYLRIQIGLDPLVWRSAVTSGHGVGKSALVSWLIYCFMSTRPDTRGLVTANTGPQLDTRTWPELSKWHDMAVNKHWFKWTATSLYFTAYPEEKQKNYMVNTQTWSEQNTDAFQGLHNADRASFIIMDEAGGIKGKLWEVIDGATTDGEVFVCAFGNPTQADGEFFDCFHKNRKFYYKMRVDSRSVSHTNKKALQDIIDKYGADSDEVRVRIKGEFPRTSFSGLFSSYLLNASSTRELIQDLTDPLIMGVDVARFGRDSTVFTFRRGNDARTLPIYDFKGLDNVQCADLIVKYFLLHRADAVIIESVGPGVGVIDILRHRNFPVYEVHPGSGAEQFLRYVNKRAQYYAELRDWMHDQGCIPEHQRLHEDLLNVRYGTDMSDSRMTVESKKEMMRRDSTLPSPDFGDSLALTFAVKIAKPKRPFWQTFMQPGQNWQPDGGYDPISQERCFA